MKPDASKPTLLGGDFADTRKDGSPVGWHYARNVKIIPATNLPKKEDNGGTQKMAHFVGKTLKEKSSFEYAQLLQGFPVDGSKVEKLNLEYWFRGKNIVARRGPVLTNTGLISFFDEKRNIISEQPFGRCNGSFNWTKISEEIPVPPEAKEAIILLGIPLATGELDVYGVSLKRGG